jgi:hypothetical protein
MKQLYSLLFIFLFLGISCNRSKSVQEVSENTDSLKVNTNRIVSVMEETLIPSAKKGVSGWREYKEVDEFIIKYYNISNTEALNNAEELVGLIQLMKDTVRVEKLKELNIKARFNVLHNEALRLQDMASIVSITDVEVKEEVKKIIEIYSALNSKINTIYKADQLQKSLEIDTETPIEIIKEELIPSDESGERLIKPIKRVRKKIKK